MAIDDKIKVILPPSRMKIVRTQVDNGPSLHTIEHCVCTPNFEDIVHRAPSFSVFIPLCLTSEEIRWEDHRGLHDEEVVDIVITGLKRINSFSLFLGGHLKRECTADPKLLLVPPTVTILYCIKSIGSYLARRGSVDFSRESYLGSIRTLQERKGYS